MKYLAFLKVFKGNVVRTFVYLTFVLICGSIFYDYYFHISQVAIEIFGFKIPLKRAHIFPLIFVLIFCWAYIIDDITMHYDKKAAKRKAEKS